MQSSPGRGASPHFPLRDGRSTRSIRQYLVALACRARRTVRVRPRSSNCTRLLRTRLSRTSPRRAVRNADEALWFDTRSRTIWAHSGKLTQPADSWERLSNWRRKRDSNPRASYPASGFQDRRLRPLGHSSTRILSKNWLGSQRQARTGGLRGGGPVPIRLAASGFDSLSPVRSLDARREPLSVSWVCVATPHAEMMAAGGWCGVLLCSPCAGRL